MNKYFVFLVSSFYFISLASAYAGIETFFDPKSVEGYSLCPNSSNADAFCNSKGLYFGHSSFRYAPRNEAGPIHGEYYICANIDGSGSKIGSDGSGEDVPVITSIECKTTYY